MALKPDNLTVNVMGLKPDNLTVNVMTMNTGGPWPSPIRVIPTCSHPSELDSFLMMILMSNAVIMGVKIMLLA